MNRSRRPALIFGAHHKQRNRGSQRSQGSKGKADYDTAFSQELNCAYRTSVELVCSPKPNAHINQTALIANPMVAPELSRLLCELRQPVYRSLLDRHVNQRAKLRRAKNNSSRWNDGVFVIILWNGNHQIARLFTLGYLGTTYVASRNAPHTKCSRFNTVIAAR
jgi:hypothetical protein